MEGLQSTVDDLVREHIIRGRDPRDPAASQNGVKSRTMVLVLSLMTAVFLGAGFVGMPYYVGAATAGMLTYVLIKLVVAPINDACEEWNEREQRIRERSKVGDG